jgi:hypothetical protein
MRHYLQTLVHQHSDCGLSALLEQIVADPNLHARFVNTLSRMEYVGVRKMLKARHSDHLDLDGLQHVLEEASHALRLKKTALALDLTLKTYSAAHTLAGAAGEQYLQNVDAACQLALQASASDTKADLPLSSATIETEANYLLSSAAIEVRADAFYPVYEKALLSVGSPHSVRAILKDEQRHLAEMAQLLNHTLPNWRAKLESAVRAERWAFAKWIDAIKLAVMNSAPTTEPLAKPSIAD